MLTPMNQSATWKSRTGNDGYQDTYTSSTIKCRFSQEQTSVIGPNNNEIISTAAIRCVEDVRPFDCIVFGSEYLVLAVRDITGVGGGIIEREVRL
jgi:hypothetical protein